MTSFESKITRIPAPVEMVYAKLSDLNNLEALRNMIPADKAAQIKDMRFDTDSCTVNVDPVGELTFKIIDREPPKTIKFTAEKSPLPLFLWIQLFPVDEYTTKTRITIKAEINAFLKPMVSKPLQEAIDRMADVLTVIPYNM
ncbi:MAG: SRPBCC family protein [Bacteroidaceae bacterium]|nr:SRPBCC family protein [Bacteroidaceae bacterium]